MAGKLLDAPVELTKCETVASKFPASTEIVIERKMDLSRHVPYALFGEYTVHYGYDARG